MHRWEHPALKDISNRRSKKWSDIDVQRLRYNSIIFVSMIVFYLFGLIHFITDIIVSERKISSSSSSIYDSIFSILFYTPLCISGLNIIFSLWKYSADYEKMDDIYLNSAQRKLMGLNDETFGATDDGEKYRNIEPPKLEKKSTPFKKSNFTPHSGTSIRHHTTSGASSPAIPSPSSPSLKSGRLFLSSSSPSSQPISPGIGMMGPVTPTRPLSKNILSTPMSRKSITATSPPISVKSQISHMQSPSQNSIADADYVDRMMQEMDEDFETHKRRQAPLARIFSPVALVSPYQPAVKSKTRSVPSKQNKSGDMFRFIDAQTVTDELKIEPYVDEWILGVRKWFGTHLLTFLLKRIEKVNSSFKEAGLENFDFSKPIHITSSLSCTTGSTSAPGMNVTNIMQNNSSYPSSTGISNQQIPNSFADLYQKLGNSPMVQERFKVESYLVIEDYPHARDYILHRLQELGSTSFMSVFKWNSGSVWERKPWNHEKLPSDAIILLHIFSKFLDEMLASETGTDTFFTSKYIRPFESAVEVTAKDIQIRTKTKYPPHFNLSVGNQVWDVPMGRENLFQAMSIFLFYLKIMSGGYISVLNLETRPIRLLQIVDHSPRTMPKQL